MLSFGLVHRCCFAICSLSDLSIAVAAQELSVIIRLALAAAGLASDNADMISEHPVVLITGASSGIGQACARRLARQQAIVYGTSRQQELVLNHCEPWTLLPMDITDAEAIAAGVARILKEQGRIDVLINNAGYGLAGAVEDVSLGEAQDIFDTNVLGAIRLCQAVIPAMRKQEHGTIINISSLAGRIALPFQGLYSATKHAIEGLSETLRMELRPQRICVVLVEPGDIHTRFTEHRRFAAANATSIHSRRLRRALDQAETDERNGAKPELVARTISRILRARFPRPRYTVGQPLQRLVWHLKTWLPARWFEALLSRYYGVR